MRGFIDGLYLILDSASEFKDRGHFVLVRREQFLFTATLTVQDERLQGRLVDPAFNANHSGVEWGEGSVEDRRISPGCYH